ncbi:hypothetical protein IQ279_04975 [Streptomyces verrucosisporus]|uniref:hypothetical protein n=1 Tax=Streptomyces verrucosisporus TaxID=1695161 RepID=UPI0019D271A8|nr:hypothetical protein [Streptomyces verrucosisporus]MBN3928997.1 hypothetical protein [Streptomyces verrucosisporus]
MGKPDKHSDDSGRTREAQGAAEARETGERGGGRRAARGASREGGAPPPWRTGRDREQDAWQPAPDGRAERGGEDGPGA